MKRIFLFLFGLWILIPFVFPPHAYAQSCGSPSTDVGPELAEPRAGASVVAAQNFSGVVSVINYLNQGETNAINTVPNKSLNPVNVLRVDIDANTSNDNIIAWANSLNMNYSTEFPCGVKVIVVSVEMNNLDWWYGGSGHDSSDAAIKKAGGEYEAKFKVLAEHLKVPAPLAPAPPDLFNGVYAALPWMQGFSEAGGCSYAKANVADIFELSPQPQIQGYTWDTVYHYQEQNLCGNPVIHFEGWGINPNDPSPGPEVKDQVKWYQTHTPPVTASTLIVPICDRKRVYPYWWYYLDGKVFTPDGQEVDPENCGIKKDICDYDNPAEKTNDIEFHSLRPYPACPFEPVVADVSYYMCANDLIANEKIRVQYNGGAGATSCVEIAAGVMQCRYDFENRTIPIDVDLSQTKFPIMGLTEGPYVNNSEYRKFGDLTDAQKVNEYVSWYLNGTTDRAEGNLLKVLPSYPAKDPKMSEEEYQNRYDDVRKLIDYSGPLKKLLPLDVQYYARIEQINRAEESIKGTIEDPTEARHNQIAACTYKIKTSGIWQIIGGLQTGGKALEDIPGPCYPENEGSSVQIDELFGIHLGFSLGSVSVEIDRHRLLDWKKNKKLPPFYDPDKMSFSEYWKEYKKWEGEYCTPTVLGVYLCFDEKSVGLPDLGRPNFWGKLWSYIPFSSTEDRIGYAEGDLTATEQPGGDVAITQIAFEPENGADGKIKYLYFPHMQEDKELGDLLQSTYVPQGEDKLSDLGNRQVYDTQRCEPVESRVNPGDKLHGNVTTEGDEIPTISGDIKYSGSYKCQFTYDPTTATWSDCEILASTALSVYSAVPLVEDVYSRYVNGDMSVFKRFYPKIGPDTPVEKIEDIPAEGQLSYTSGGENPETWAGKPESKRPGSNAKIYFPHIGSIYDYFLKGIQKALRPFDTKLVSTTIGQPPGGMSTEQLQSCFSEQKTQQYIQDTSLSVLDPLLKSALSQAAAAYNLPVCILEAVLTTEGSQMRVLTHEQAVILTSEWQYDDPIDVFIKQFGLTNPEAQELYKLAYCAPNEASAAGPMQIVNTIWYYHGGASKEKGAMSSSHHANRCNFVDAVYTEAAMQDAKLRSKEPWTSPYGYGYSEAPISMSDPEPFCYAGEGAYGSCRMDAATCRLGTDYCDYVREYCGVPGDCSEYRPTGAR